MSNPDEPLKQLLGALSATAEITGTVLTAQALALMVQDLAAYPHEAIMRALAACRRELKGRLTLAAIIERLQIADGHPPGNEAWALVLKGRDDEETIVWTEQMAEAWGIAHEVLKNGDEVGARMAFLSAYDRKVQIAREDGLPATWSVSLGWNKELRESAIQEAVARGYLSAPAVAHLLPAPAPEPGANIAGLLTGTFFEPPADASDEVRDRWNLLRHTLENAQREAAEERERKVQEARARTAARKAELLDQLERYQRDHPQHWPDGHTQTQH